MVFLAEGTERAMLARLRDLLAPGGRILWLRAGGDQEQRPHGTRPRSSRPTSRRPGSGSTCGPGRYELHRPVDDYAVWLLARAGPRVTRTTLGPESDYSASSSSTLRVSKTGSGSGCGSCFLASCTSEWAPQPWSKRDHPAVVVGVAVGADAEGVDQRAGHPDQEAAAAAEVGRGLGQRRLGAAVAVVPALGGELAALEREGADPAEAELVGDVADLGLVVGVERVVAEGVRRHQPRVVVGDRQQVAGRQVAGLDPLPVGHPRRRDDRLVAGDQHDLVDGDVLLRGRPGDGDRPAPADVAAAGAGEQVGDQPLALDDVRRGGRRRRRRRRRSSSAARAVVDRRHGDGVGLGAHGSVVTGASWLIAAPAVRSGRRASARMGAVGQDASA